jgi:beta-N-acetylhexosaminidase
MLPVIYGLSGPALTADERAFFREADPLGYILFARNVVDRGQLRALTNELRALSGRDDLPILIDQEGGPVARMKPPEWPATPAGPAFARLWNLAPSSAIEAARVNAQAIGLMLAEVGISVDCLPLLDVAVEGATPAVASRTYGGEPMQVAALGRAVLDGLAAWSSTCPATAARASTATTNCRASPRRPRNSRSISNRSARWPTLPWA